MDENPYKAPRDYRFSLRTLMIALAVGPPLIAGAVLTVKFSEFVWAVCDLLLTALILLVLSVPGIAVVIAMRFAASIWGKPPDQVEKR